MVQMTKSMATAWAKDNIQVNAILPGWIDTALTRRAREQIQGLHDNVLEAHAGRPLGRARRLRRHRGVPGGGGVGFRDRRRHHRRRRLLGAGLILRTAGLQAAHDHVRTASSALAHKS